MEETPHQAARTNRWSKWRVDKWSGTCSVGVCHRCTLFGTLVMIVASRGLDGETFLLVCYRKKSVFLPLPVRARRTFSGFSNTAIQRGSVDSLLFKSIETIYWQTVTSVLYLLHGGLRLVNESLAELKQTLSCSLSTVLSGWDPQMLLLQSLGPGARRQATQQNITMQGSAPWLRAQCPPLSLRRWPHIFYGVLGVQWAVTAH